MSPHLDPKRMRVGFGIAIIAALVHPILFAQHGLLAFGIAGAVALFGIHFATSRMFAA